MTVSSSTLPKSTFRQPRGYVSVNGIQVPWQQYQVTTVRYGAAGTFHVTMPVSSLPVGARLNDLISNPTLMVQINAGLPLSADGIVSGPSDLPLEIIGLADDVAYDPLKSMITLTGRDYIGRFIETKINQTFLNKVSSDVISLLATQQGLFPNVSSTSTDIGQYFQAQPNFISASSTQWDLMTFLAREEQYDIFVKGSDLYFQPKSTAAPYPIILTTPYYSTAGANITSNAIDIQLSRNLRLAKDIMVTVSTWNVADKKTYKKTATLKHTSGKASSTPNSYSYFYPNLSVNQVQAKAMSLLQQISQHELTLRVTMPADPTITPQSTLIMKNTNTVLDQIYYVNSVTREMDYQTGYLMTVEAKTIPPYNTTVS